MNRDVCEHFNPVDLPCAKCQEKRKSEALFLADELEIPLGTVIGSEVQRRAAAELRRLHAQRDALLEALKQIEPILARMYGPQAAELPPMQIVRAAIKAAEENT